MKTILIILVFLILGALFIISNQGLSLHDPENFRIFGETYYSWFDHLFDNGKTIVGYVAKSEWLPNENAPLDLSQ